MTIFSLKFQKKTSDEENIVMGAIRSYGLFDLVYGHFSVLVYFYLKTLRLNFINLEMMSMPMVVPG